MRFSFHSQTLKIAESGCLLLLQLKLERVHMFKVENWVNEEFALISLYLAVTVDAKIGGWGGGGALRIRIMAQF